MKKKLLSLGLAFLVGSFSLTAQNEMKAIQKYTNDKNIPTLSLTAPNRANLAAEDLERDKNGQLHRIGVSIFSNITTGNSGIWKTMSNGDRVWQLKIKSPGAEALGFLFSSFKIYGGATVDVFSPDGKRLHEQVTSADVQDHFQQHIEMCAGDEMMLQLTEPKGTQSSEFLLTEIMYGYRDTGKKINKDFGDSESCEVNINCTEGANWQDEKRGVARILVKEGSNYGYCSGSLVNNTAQDCKPLFLTALHCGVSSSTADFNQWKFYFMFEAPGCADSGSEASLATTAKTITGSVKLASSNDGGGDSGSDFLLVQLGSLANQATTVTKLKSAAINAYWNGWDANNTTTNSGAGIHHPAGDIKKISAFSSNLITDGWNGNGLQSHWRLSWISTTNGHGITEGGSSGSPLFTNNGGNSRIVGTLTGGSSYCNTPTSPDFYGKMSYHWQSNTTPGNIPLKNFLDPGNTGALVLNGSNDPCAAVTPAAPVANFSATPVSVTSGGTVQFTDLSTNAPTTWSWSITPGTAGTAWSYIGGTSATSQNPQVQFNTVGQYTVTLTASNTYGSDAETKTNYITVTAAPSGPCAATSTSCTYESINNVTLGSINNTTGCTNYGNYTNMSTVLVKGQSYTASIIPAAEGTVGTAYTNDEIAIYIDWNNDNDFTDAGERVGYVLVGAGWSNQFTFTVPSTATVGTLRMRCRISYQPDAGAINPCGTTADGEVEDYSVVVQNANSASIDENNVLGAVNIYPNPFQETITVDLSSVKDQAVTVQIFDLAGKLLRSVENQSGSVLEINMAGYAKGMYQVILKSGEAQSIQRIVKQ